MQNKSGFTIIELIIAFGLFSVLAVATTVMLTAVLRATARASAQNRVINEGEFLTESMYQQLRYAQNVVCDPSANPQFVTITPVNSNTTVTFNCDSANNALGKNGTGVNNDISSPQVKITNCSFSCLGLPPNNNPVDNVEVSFSVQDLNGVVQPVIYDSNIVLRNSP